jgi:hypothetical protein
MKSKEDGEISIFLKILFTLELVLTGALILYIVYLVLIAPS